MYALYKVQVVSNFKDTSTILQSQRVYMLCDSAWDFLSKRKKKVYLLQTTY
jgi:hypothetical protein